MNRSGKVSGTSIFLGLISVLLILIVAGVFFFFGPAIRETTVPSVPGQPQQVQVLQTGKSASAKFAAFDNSADSRTQVGDSKLYVWELDALNEGSSGSRLIQNGVTMSATDRTSVATSTGKHLWAIAFNESSRDGGYYGAIRKNLKVETETPQFDLETWKAMACGETALTECGKVTIFKDGTGKVVSSDTAGAHWEAVNVSIGAAGTFSLDKIRWENNETNTAFRLGGIIFNASSAAPIDLINFEGEGNTGSLTAIGTPRKYSSMSRSHAYKLNSPKMLLEFQNVETGTIKIKTTGSCATARPIMVHFMDEGEFLKKTDSSYASGIEDDADTATDTGVGDPATFFQCTT